MKYHPDQPSSPYSGTGGRHDFRISQRGQTLLELSLWKAKIEEKEEDSLGKVEAKRVTMDIQSSRSEQRITSGANTVIKNVLAFLELK
eukprot:scaffold4144_cov154-Skeletonema_dohrnii-CCMP3373.AAC.2